MLLKPGTHRCGESLSKCIDNDQPKFKLVAHREAGIQGGAARTPASLASQVWEGQMASAQPPQGRGDLVSGPGKSQLGG